MTRTSMKSVYWTATILFALPLLWSGLQYLVDAPKMMTTMSHLGYPPYFSKILGVAKVLGVAALLYPAWPRLKEWAYAGFTFDVIGAFVSHLSSGDSLTIALVPIGFLALLVVSYWSWRKLGIDATTRASERRLSDPLGHAGRGGVPA
jgi:uncharacterized membrane protein YphA (DoxX/SURF4 family)